MIVIREDTKRLIDDLLEAADWVTVRDAKLRDEDPTGFALRVLQRLQAVKLEEWEVELERRKKPKYRFLQWEK